MTALLVAVAGAAGCSRAGASGVRWRARALIRSTVAINIAGSFLLGLLAAESWFSRDVREALGVGFLGGFTTFSTFSVQLVLDVDGRGRGARVSTWSSRWSAGSPRRRPGTCWAAGWPER